MSQFKEILKIGVASFCEHVYLYDSLDEDEYKDTLINHLLGEESADEYLSRSTADVRYDIVNIDNIYDNSTNKDKVYSVGSIIYKCTKAYKITIKEDKTINVEAFVDNLTKELER